MEDWVYCDNCDRSFPESEFIMIPVDELHERYGCPNCDHIFPKAILNDYGFFFQQYLLSGSEFDEGVGLPVYKP